MSNPDEKNIDSANPDETVIQLEDVARLVDEGANANITAEELRGGIVDMYAEGENGALIPIFQKRKNIIVLRGRTFGLEKLFGVTIGTAGVDSGIPYKSDLNRTILAFGVGNNGAPASAPFSPHAPVPNGVNGQQLSNQIPFRYHDDASLNSGNPALFIPREEIGVYGGATPITNSTTKFNYYYKRFQNDGEWYFNATENTVYRKLTLRLSPDDCRTAAANYVNELSLFIGRARGNDARGGIQYENMELFSRVTFPTEFLSLGKALTWEYRVYA